MKEIFEEIFDAAPDAMIVTDIHGCIVNVNQQALKLFGYERDKLVGKQVEILIPSDLAVQHHIHRQNYINAPRMREMGKGMVLKAIKKNGSEFNAEISLSPIGDNKPLFISAAIRDVTEKMQMLDSLKRHETLLQEQNEQLKNFAYIVSHNLRSYANNINIMLAFVEDSVPSEKADIMGHLKKTAAALADTIKDLDKIVAVHAARKDQMEKVNVNQCIEKILEILGPDIDRYGVAIRKQVPETASIECIPAYLESIFFNLLSNSIKYRSPCRAPIITIRYFKENDNAVMQFSDNGLGIDLNKYGPKLFGLYQTFHANAEAKGVGLFITRKQVEVMGGRIEVQSQPGEGTTFTIYFS